MDGKRNDADRTFQRDNRYRYNQRGVNCAVARKKITMWIITMGIGGNSDNPCGHPLSQVNFTDGWKQLPHIEVEFGDIGGRETDIDVVNYLVSRSVSGEYRDAGRTGDFDMLKTSAWGNSARRFPCEKGTYYTAIWTAFMK